MTTPTSFIEDTPTSFIPDAAVQAAPQPSANTYGAFFPADPNDSPLAAGAKAAGNLPSSAFNLAKTVVGAASHPIRTLNSIGQSATGALDIAAEKLGLFKNVDPVFNQDPKAHFSALADALHERYGSPENLQATATNDPVGFATDVLSVFTGGAALAGKGAEAASLVGKTGNLVTRPVARSTAATSNLAEKTAKFATTQATGLEPTTIATILDRPAALSQAQKSGLNRSTLGADLQTRIDDRIAHLSDLGKGYEPIRNAQSQVTLPEDWFTSILQNHKIGIVDGKITTSKESTVLSPADINALQHFHDLYGKEALHSPNSYLNTRDALTQLSKYDAAKTGNLQAIARDARTELNRYRNQMDGLKQLDEQYAPEVQDLNAIKKEWLDPKTGELKDSALSRITNATNETNAKRLERLELVQPGISGQIKLVRAIEDIEKASGIKVGTYTRAVAVGGLGLTGNVPAAVVTAILSAPEVAVPLIKGLGYTKAKIAPLLQTLKQIGGDINNFRSPISLPRIGTK